MALPPDRYTVGWICGHSTEQAAALQFMDELYGHPKKVERHDDNNYMLGRVGVHNVVTAILPHGKYGTSPATAVARDMLHTFPNIRIGLMVGTGGGAPSTQNDIRLGDIVVSTPKADCGGIFQYDFGKFIQDKDFKRTGHLNEPPQLLLATVNGLAAKFEKDGNGIAEAIEAALERNPSLRKENFGQPDPSTDRLYKSNIVHPDPRSPDQLPESCIAVCGDGPQKLVPRRARTEYEDSPMIFHGIIASGNAVMRDSVIRDTLSREQGVLCFEMEAAGLMNWFPCLVVRGICNYSDTHKNDVWRRYAAMSAAAYTRELLLAIAPNTLEAK